ncbi:MAG TPA: hypothetical protein VF796_18155, partial [Humisphaera sp.]
MPSLCDHDVPSLEAALAAAGAAPSHARKVLRAFYAAGGEPALDVATVGKPVLRWLDASRPLVASTVLRKTVAADGTTKLLVGYPAGGSVECVLMPTHRADRTMACVS